MQRNILLCVGVAGALALSAPAFAHGGGGGGGGMGGGMGGLGAHGDMGGMGNHGEDSTTFRDNSQGPSNASPTGGANANSHSVVHGAGTPTGPLAGLTKGMTLTDANGATIGTISRVIRSKAGVVRNVLVTPASSTGLHRHTLPVRPSTITLSGTTAQTSLTLSALKG